MAEGNKKITEKLKDELKQHNKETHKAVESIRKTVDDVEHATNDKVTTAIEHYSEQLDDMSRHVERLQQCVMEAETKTSIRAGGEIQRKMRYDGTSLFPMEFLKELSKFRHRYYNLDKVKWIANT